MRRDINKNFIKIYILDKELLKLNTCEKFINFINNV